MKTKLITSVLAVFLAASNFLSAQNDRAVSVVRAYFVGVDAGESQKMADLFSADFMASAPFLPQPVPLEVWRGIGAGFKAGFPDMRHEIVDWVSDGHKVAVRGVFTGTNTGAMQGNPPTGNKVALPFNTIFELDKDLKIKALYIQFDQAAMQQQLMAGIDPNAKTEATMRAYFAALDAGDPAKLAAFCAPNMVQHFSGEPGPLNLADVQKRAAGFKAGFPDATRQIDEIVVSGNTVTIRGTFKGTNTGMFRGKPATGRRISIPHLAFFRLNAQGLIEEVYVELDTKLVEQQLGTMETAGNK